MYIFRNRNIENALMVVCPPAGCGIITSGRKHHHFCIKNGANLQRKTACGAASGRKAAADREHIRGRGSLRTPLSHTRIRTQAPERAAEFSSPRVRGRFFQQFGKKQKYSAKNGRKNGADFARTAAATRASAPRSAQEGVCACILADAPQGQKVFNAVYSTAAPPYTRDFSPK